MSQIASAKTTPERQETVSVATVASPIDLDDIDALIDEIDAVLEENAEVFVRCYVQKGGE
jgi:ubiquitin-like protein Pup